MSLTLCHSKRCCPTAHRPFILTIFSPPDSACWPPTTTLPLLSQTRTAPATPEADPIIPSRKLRMSKEKCIHCYLQEQRNKPSQVPQGPVRHPTTELDNISLRQAQRASPRMPAFQIQPWSLHSCTKGSPSAQADQLFPLSEGEFLLHTDEDDISSYLCKAQTGQDTRAKHKGTLWQLLKRQVSQSRPAHKNMFTCLYKNLLK